MLTCHQEKLSLLPPATVIRTGVLWGRNVPIFRLQTCLSRKPKAGQARSQRSCLQFSLGIERHLPAILHWGSGEETELSKIRNEDMATISDDCKTWSFKLNISRDRISTVPSQPYYCFTRTQCLNSHVIQGLCAYVSIGTLVMSHNCLTHQSKPKQSEQKSPPKQAGGSTGVYGLQTLC